MIAPKMRSYSCEILGALDEYAQSIAAASTDTVLISLSEVNHSNNDNVLYSDAEYIGFTFNRDLDDTYILITDKGRLKVTYVNRDGRYNVVYLKRE